MFNIIKTFIILLLMFFSVNVSFTDVNSDLKNRKQELNKLHTDISNKKAEKNKLVKEEKKVKQELQRIQKSIDKNEKELKSLKDKISETEKKLQFASDVYNESDMSKQKYAQKLNNKYLSYTKMKLVSYFDYPIEYKIKYEDIENNSRKYNVAKDTNITAQSDINKYTTAKKEYENLKNKQQNLMEKNKKLQKDKNALLKTTAGKRVKAEHDIKELNNSEKALKALVDKLMKASQNQNKTTKPASTNTRKNNLPWPVNGKIVLNYGKNKHPDLDTNVISNGIKIKAQDYSTIKSVEDGTVVFVGEFRSYGKMIIVDHKGIFFSVYGQLDKISVKEDQKIVRQQEVAKVGKGDESILYFEIRQYNVPENPLLWLKEKK
ncbi:murein hydrolase activator EnvC family protein [Candidatus Ruminimicrobiellum ovillum]|uniref:murein hydrolase activator EnvC family protein n=1 Tax=Candidatus Ruminimicrobiellum ovillum TaxID=1947927 RepID=UPI0035593B13